MAAIQNRQVNRRNYSNAAHSYTNTYINGNVVRRVEAVPKRREERRTRQVQTNVKRNRERQRNVNRPYAIFLTLACIATVVVCVNYLQLQAEGITYRNKIANLESTLTSMKLTNDNAYEDVISSVSMDQIKETAINELGMSYATEGQIRTYDSQDGDYIRQYMEVPTE